MTGVWLPICGLASFLMFVGCLALVVLLSLALVRGVAVEHACAPPTGAAEVPVCKIVMD